ncbi:hypothetical protein [Streptomyces sp. CRN 30]|uniref:hypothetical protein n=1 Tax=Streptomyces sp. CRN 30 TaxID=3075613 RepID=UPI002A800D94|nr:hypothetical protein [Streptomyces sp. CRN 30]
MRRTARLLTGTALAAAAAGLVVAAPAYGGEDGDPSGALLLRPVSVAPGDPAAVDTTACGESGTAAGDASAVGAGSFTLTPEDGGTVATGQFRVPPGAQPGTYEIVATCAGNGRRVTGDLVVTLSSAAHVAPRGSVKTGVGGALGPDPVQTAAGVAALAVAAAGGTWLLHRRARGDGI